MCLEVGFELGGDGYLAHKKKAAIPNIRGEGVDEDIKLREGGHNESITVGRGP